MVEWAENAGAKILVVDDEPSNVRLLERMLGDAGYRAVRSTTDSRQAQGLCAEWAPDLLLLDLMMPHLDGVAVLQQLRAREPRDEYLPVLVLTADIAAASRRRALLAGATDFVTKPLDNIEVLLRIKNLLHARALQQELARQNRQLEDTVRERTRQLLQTEKVATMGTLLAGVAHELNNPLAVLMGYATLLRSSLDGDAQAERAEKILRAAERCSRIVRNFLSLARQRPPERQRAPLNHIVREAVELLAYPLRVDGIEVVLELADDLPPLWADPHQLHQIVVNLVTNAHHAMRETPPPRRLRMVTRHHPAAASVCLEVEDSGPGVPPEVRTRIFEQFFTTKPQGQGTGLGLSLCRGVVEAHGGSIRVESEPGQGATFVIELPLHVPGDGASMPGEGAAEPHVGAQRILLVEDEPEITGLLRDVLQADGHRVETAPDGAAALTRVGRQDYDVILSDVRMPMLDGPSLLAELGRRDPRLARRVIFVTGDLLSPETRSFLERSGAPSVGKPFAIEELRRAIARVAARETVS